MTNQEIDKVVADSDRSASIGVLFPVAASWVFSGLALLISVLVGPTIAADSLLNFLGIWGFVWVEENATIFTWLRNGVSQA